MKKLLALFLFTVLVSFSACSQTIWNPSDTYYPTERYNYTVSDSIISLPEGVCRYVFILPEQSLGSDTLYVSTSGDPRIVGTPLTKNDKAGFVVPSKERIKIKCNATGYIFRYWWER